VAAKRPEDMAQQPEEARRLAEAAGCGWLVCGHVHRARDEALGPELRWLVVDAFGGARDAVRVGRGGLALCSSGAGALGTCPAPRRD
jgi:UDP-2,3-diacylglucosamine pyrophosphatase LpxH